MENLLEVRDLRIEAPKKNAPAVQIVKGVSFDVKPVKLLP
jgi:ABC-type glutathione transport system ATPase component